MATFPLSGGAQFPDGTSVSVYPRTAWSAEDLSGAPSGAAAGNSPQTITGGSATFTGLADATDYVAYANVGGQNRYRRFTTRVDALQSAGSSTGAWAPNTAYVKGQPVVAPDGSLVIARRSFTSGATFNPASWIYPARTSGQAAAVPAVAQRTLDDVFRAVIAQAGLINAFALQETAGTVAQDFAGTSDGNITGPMVLGADGPMGASAFLAPNAFALGAQTAAYVDVPHVAAMNWADVFTYVVVFRRNFTHNGAGHVLLSKGTGNIQLALNADKVRLRKNGTGDLFVSNESVVDVHRWHLLVCRKNGATVSARLDGVELTNSTGVAQTGVATTLNLQVGEATTVGALALAMATVGSSYVPDATVQAWEAMFTGRPAPVEFATKVGVHGERQAAAQATRAAINPLVKAMHSKIVRSKTDLAVIAAGATEPGVGDYTAHDPAIQEVEAAGMENLLVLYGSPQWMNGSADHTVVPGAGSATDPAFLAWLDSQAKWIDLAVRRYMPGGAAGTNVRLWEAWNEPNLANSWKSATAPSAAQYAAYWARVRQVFAAIDPAFNTPTGILRLACGALASPRATGGSDINGLTFLDSIVTANAVFEILSFHSYDPGDPAINSGEAAGKTNDFGDIQVIRNYLQAKGRTPRLWVTEFGWSVAGVTALQQAQFLASALRIARDHFAAFLDVLLVFSDADWQGTWGLYAGSVPPFTARRAAVAFHDFATAYDVTPPARLA